MDLEQMQKFILERDIENKTRVTHLLTNEDLLDEDGYPTEAALEIIEKWHWTDKKGWFEFIKGLWWMPDFGWHEVDEPHSYRPNVLVHMYYLSTAGWSGNEALIRAMENNVNFLWTTSWVQSRRGGHYIFEMENDDEEVQDL